ISLSFKRMIIGTHSGSFHCDEALACFMIRNTEKFANSTILRTRDEKVLETCDIVVDVGGVFDLKANRFDHHQKEFNETFDDESQIKLSSAGLIYKYFGKEVIKNLSGCDDENLDLLYRKTYSGFVKAIDAIDNGIDPVKTNEKPLYKISTDLSSRVGYLNPKWNEDYSEKIQMKRFEKAMELVGKEFKESIKFLKD
ncbi:hypothetical protein MHBO_003586, partial [Bonamia ostreae]